MALLGYTNKRASRLLLSLVAVYAGEAPGTLHADQRITHRYVRALPVVEQLSQVVYYREPAPESSPGSLNLYINDKYHTSLKSGTHTVFCVKPGEHGLTIFFNSPKYAGEVQSQRFHADFAGGVTYFMQVSNDTYQTQPVDRTLAEMTLSNSLRHESFLTRSAAVQPCAYDYDAAREEKRYVFPAVSLFTNGLLDKRGRDTLRDFSVEVRSVFPRMQQVNVIVYTDAEMQTDKQRLEAGKEALLIRDALIENAISTEIITFETQSSKGGHTRTPDHLVEITVK